MPAKPLRTYFADQLADEEPLGHRTALRLCSLAAAVRAAEPWAALSETQLIAVQRRKNSEPDFVSVLGAAGEHRAIFVYPGIRGYAWAQDMQAADPNAAKRLMIAENESLRVSFVPGNELTELDAELMKACRWDAARAGVAFRSVRYGWLPWYLNEEEGQRLCSALEALMAFVSSGHLESSEENLWPEDQSDLPHAVLPMMVRKNGKWSLSMLNMRLTRVNEPQLWVSPEDLRGLPAGRKSGALCLGDVVLPSSIGGPNERPAPVHLCVAADYRSGHAFPPAVREPGTPLGISASQAVLAAIQVRRQIPETVFVPEPLLVDLLSELARVVGFALRLRRHLPMLDELFRELARYSEQHGDEDAQTIH
jgi:hypothetical protein